LPRASLLALGRRLGSIGGGGGGNLPNMIVLNSPVSGITYNSASGFQCQYAGFTAKLQFLDQDGDNDVTSVSEVWSGSAGLTIDSTYTDPQSGMPAVSFHAIAPGLYTLTCVVSYSEDGSAQKLTLTANCVAIGGILTFHDVGGSIATYLHDKLDPALPYYIEYFGYSVANGNPPNNQVPQDVKVNSTLSQPSGTTVSWAIPSYTYSPDLNSSPNENIISDLKATARGSNEAVVCTYHWSGTLNGAVITNFTAQDDTTQTPISGNSSPYLPDQVDAHQPSFVQTDTFDVLSNALMSPSSEYMMQLYDQLAEEMPNVWVNEHFTDFTPVGFTINTDGDFWTTVKTPVGDFNNYDSLSWIFNDFPPPYYAIQTYSFHHSYYGGTRSINGPWNNPTNYGFNCGSFDIQFIPYNPTQTTSTAKQ